ncbi:ribosome small subunit-dependent GTPase A [Sporosarcina gallistercoris]|uniref:Small ribosomal subunit biogenesis GTPase RsgA n=1 Tax=Sporosarcina gallistercoris TaxID=2762245 RepID=A0ABR8PG82_9BACL|nr:ribosome small subunit-dependent GTPase A [Sporosarcina gallistercoris]MBD7907176.1 ribosome small subunit-dependent GTPase A [Sporosarcina gallistercoris]
MPEGQIRKAISGFYYVKYDGGTVRCRGRGVFRKRKITPLVGDWVTYVQEGEEDATITEVHPRKNELVRPPVSNIDLALLAVSIVEPTFSSNLLDRFLVLVESHYIKPVICLTKKDKANEAELQAAEEAAAYYRSIGYSVLMTAIDEPGLLEKLRPHLEGNTTVLAGQSGVGKSTLLNTLLPNLSLETGEISESLGRGKHTTRHVELHEVAGGLVADTPGFSSLEFDTLEKQELGSCFPEFLEASEQCKFRGCLHLKEPSCEVKRLVESGEIIQSRYHHYLQFLQEITDRKPRY